MHVYPDSVNIYVRLNGTFTDISSYTVSDISGSWGIRSSDSLSRIADTGTLKFVLNNESGKFTPDSATLLSGWKIGEAVKLVITYEMEEFTRFYGKIDNVEMNNELGGMKAVTVTCVDWLDYAAKHPMLSPAIQTNKKGGQAITSILGVMPIDPQTTSFDTDGDTFPYIFDAVRSKTNAYSELTRIANSEAGYVYLQKGRVYGEKLVFESSKARHGLRTLDTIPVHNDDAGHLLAEDGGYLLAEDGGRIDLDESTTFIFDNNFYAIDIQYGENLVNKYSAVSYPRKMDTSNQVLFKLNTMPLLQSGESISIKGAYTDPAGGSQIAGINMVTPVPNTDYALNTQEDGLGTNLTSDFSVTVTYGADAANYVLLNNSTSAGYVITLQARGIGVYTYASVETSVEDSPSINVNGYVQKAFEQKYQTGINSGRRAIKRWLERDRVMQKDVKKVYFLANTSEEHMFSFLQMDVGNLIRIKHTPSNTDGYFYIQGVDFSVTQGGILNFAFIVRQAFSLALGLSMIGMEFKGNTSVDAVNYGYLPQVSNLNARSVSMWIKMDTDPAVGKIGRLVSWSGTYIFYVVPGRKLKVYQIHTGGGASYGIWTTTSAVIPLNTWTHVVLTHDNSVSVSADPIFYVNAATKAYTNDSFPAGALQDETGAEFVIGNGHASNNPYDDAIDGTLKDVRIYNRVLTTTEISTIYNSGTPNYSDVTNGLVFQAFAVKTDRLSDYVDATILSNMGLIDNIYGSVGYINGTPIGRSY